MIQNLFGDHSRREEEEDVESQHESNPHPDYASMKHRTPGQHDSIIRNSKPNSAFPSSTVQRLWRPAAQRNIRNQWSKIASLCRDWNSNVASGRSHSTSIVNAYLSQKYMDGMDFGVLHDMSNIRKKACWKLLKQQEHYRSKLLSSYKDMVAVVIHMVSACKSMRCYFKGTSNSPLAQFSSSSEDNNDGGDCGGIPVFTCWSITYFEELAWEIVRMHASELNLKRMLVMEFLSIYDDKVDDARDFLWSDEFYEGEFEDLSACTLYSKETCELMLPCRMSNRSSTSTIQSNQQQDSNVLQVYLTTWLVEANINRCRVDDVFAIVGAEIHVEFVDT